MSLDEGGIVGALVGALIIAVVGLSILGSPIMSSPVSDDTQHSDVEIVGGDGSLDTTLLTTVGNVTTVRTSLEDQVQLTGASDSSVELANAVGDAETRSVCTYGAADSDVVANNETRALVALDYLTVAYNGTSDTWNVSYYDQGTRAWYETSVAATDPATQTLVCGYTNSTHLGLSENTTDAPVVALDGSGGADAPTSQHWAGTLEETRVYDYWLNDTQQQAYVDEPVISVPGEPADARVMYDVRSRGVASVPAYFADGDASLSNASLVDGFGGPPVVEGTDYRVEGDRIVALDGGVLDGDGDVLFVTWFPTGYGLEVYLVGIGIVLFLITPLVGKLLEVAA